MPLIDINNLSVSFSSYTSGMRQQTIEVIRGLQLSIEVGQIVAVIGSSGSGKSLLAHAIMGILPDNASMNGDIYYNGEKLNAARQARLRGKEIALVPQSVNYLDPLMQIGAQVRTSVQDRQQSITLQRKAFQRYGLSSAVETLYPFQISGGMARSVLLSTAIISDAQLIIADEPTPGLHPEMAIETMRHFRALADEGRGVLLITHDIECVLSIADKIAVLYAGEMVEIAAAQDFSGNGQQLRHPYSKALWSALPQNEFTPIVGAQPLAGTHQNGCSFEQRCHCATSACMDAQPNMRELRGGQVRCIHAT